ncbi:class C sortase [Peptoniphilus harei]|uniref:Sortase (Surface protein transpeptidase) n=1 Tax=Peptoniphilus harei TaxID=54005 RepID=A0A2X1ZW92_9FIRM|nr:class C sortase [Peptoniphilus harei]QQT90443.1 class C sortase [Peptoniphilus harei]SPY47686.1 Sortase (surface protein transpeptidase) [Peptoniphilus harei]
MKAKSRVIIGYIFILLGIFLPLLAFTSMSYRELMADKNYASFKAKDSQVTDDLIDYNKEVVKGESNIIDPFDNEEYEGAHDIKGIDKDEVFAYLIIPKLDMKKPIYLDATYDHLDWGVAQVEGTSLPLGGMSTRSVIAGHRGWWGDLMFYNVDKLEVGDEILIDGRTGLLEYRVTGTDIISPSDWESILPVAGKDMVTLLTCHPKRPPRPKRLLINAERVEEKKTEVKPVVEDKTEVNYLKYGIYGITLAGWIAMVLVFIRMVGYIRSSRRRARRR